MAIISISGRIGSGKDTMAEIIQLLTYCDYSEDTGRIASAIQQWDHSAKHELETHGYWKVRKFADKLKDIVCLLIGCTREQLEDREFKNTELGEEWTAYEIISNHAAWCNLGVRKVFGNMGDAYAWIDTLVHIENPRLHFGTKLVDLTPRLLLQLIGTEAGRNLISPNIWVNALFADYGNTKAQHWIITDMRFPNEKKAIENRGGITIRIERKTELRYPDLWYAFQQSAFDEWDEFLKENGMFDSVYHDSETALDSDENWDFVIENNGSMEDLIEQVRTIIASDLFKERTKGA